MVVSTATERSDTRYVSERIRKTSVNKRDEWLERRGWSGSAYLSDQWGTDKELKGQRYSDGSILDFRFLNKHPTVTPDTLEGMSTLVPMG